MQYEMLGTKDLGAFKDSEKDLIERKWKTNSSNAIENYTSMTYDFVCQRPVMKFEPKPYYYQNLEEIVYGRLCGGSAVRRSEPNLKIMTNNRKRNNKNYEWVVKEKPRTAPRAGIKMNVDKTLLNIARAEKALVDKIPRRAKGQTKVAYLRHRGQVAKGSGLQSRMPTQAHIGRGFNKGALFNARDRNKYMETLLAPEVHMSRVPFLIGLPTAICKIRSIFTVTALHNRPILAFNFNPNAILCVAANPIGPDASFAYPFSYEETHQVTGEVVLTEHVENPTLFPQLHGEILQESKLPDIMTNGRVVGASLQCALTNKLFDRAGTMTISRTYQDIPTSATDRTMNFVAVKQA